MTSSQTCIAPDLALDFLQKGRESDKLFAQAAHIRDEGKGRTITYSRKVFIPLTTLCRDQCGYCTFAQPPRQGGAFMTPDQVLATARAGETFGCTEALFTLGDQPETRWDQARSFLSEHGHTSTMSYLRQMTEMVVDKTTLLPHANPGLMTHQDLMILRPSNPSVGMMLENSSDRLTESGQAHHRCYTKQPGRRIATIRAAALARVPFTTGILVGIGEKPEEIVDSLFLLAELHQEGRHLNEIIIQNFRAKHNIRMRRHPEPVPDWFARVVVLARLVMGPTANIQVPPNLTERYERYLEAGINDWGGVSPLTMDWVNPEAPWPNLEELERRTRAAGFRLEPRLPVYPEFISSEWIDSGLLAKVHAATDDLGYARIPQLAVR